MVIPSRSEFALIFAFVCSIAGLQNGTQKMAKGQEKRQKVSFPLVQGACSKCHLKGTTNCTISSRSVASLGRCILSHSAALPSALLNRVMRHVLVSDEGWCSNLVESIYYRIVIICDVIVKGQKNDLERQIDVQVARTVRLAKRLEEQSKKLYKVRKALEGESK